MTQPPTSGPRLTCHVLDTTAGRPAAGMRIALSRLGGPGGPELLVAVVTNADGRTDEPLLTGPAFVPGRYELAFSVGDHFGLPATARYLDVVPVHVGIGPDDRHVHVALLVTPWSYTTYRGS